MIRTIIMMSTVICLGGCASALTSSNPPPVTYALHAQTAVQTASSEASGVMFVLEPGLPAGFDTDQIALYMDNGRRLDYFSGSQWAAPLDKVLQDVIVQAGRQQLPGMIIDSPDLNIPAQYKLATKVNNFSPVYRNGPDGTPLLKLSMTFTLVQMPIESVLMDFTLESEQPAADNSVSAITSGLEAMLQTILPRAYSNLAEALVRSGI